MKIRIETTIDPAALKAFLKDNPQLRVPVFFDKNAHIVLTVNNKRQRGPAIAVIAWLMAR